MFIQEVNWKAEIILSHKLCVRIENVQSNNKENEDSKEAVQMKIIDNEIGSLDALIHGLITKFQ